MEEERRYIDEGLQSSTEQQDSSRDIHYSLEMHKWIQQNKLYRGRFNATAAIRT
jgi:hypothetical protein